MATITRRSLPSLIRRYSQVSHRFNLNPGKSALYLSRTEKCRPLGAYRFLSTQTEANISESNKGTTSEKLEFQAETRMLLDIVARSLYSNNEVFLRELISNASDALEKLRYTALSGNLPGDIGSLEVRIGTNKQEQLLTIEDNGIGMTREELISNLGTIARSGSKAFLEELKNNKSADISSIIGQFGVGFYSSFVVAKKVEVYTKSVQENAQGYCWTYNGSDQYEIREVEGLSRGTKIVIHLKSECREYADDNRVREIIKKYSNFVNCPIFVDNEKCNVIEPLWLMDAKKVTDDEYTEFYRFVSNSYDEPRFKLHYSTDAPLTIKALLYVPTVKPALGTITEAPSISLYAKRVLIKNKAKEILPEWCYFLKGVVDSEDIPLNLSRELLQNSPLIAKLREVLGHRVIKFLSNCAHKEPEKYEEFYNDYHIYLKSGIMAETNHSTQEELAKLLRFETSNTKPNEYTSLTRYLRDMPSDQSDIYYLFAPSRAIADSSPYLETLKKKGFEVLFCYGIYDEHVMHRLQTFRNKKIKSAENEISEKSDNVLDFGDDALKSDEMEELITWTKEQLKDGVSNVKFTNKLDRHPCVVTLEDITAARQVLKIHEMRKRINAEARKMLFTPCLELNPKHAIIKKLFSLSKSDPELARLLIKQLLANAMLTADLVEDAGSVVVNMNELFTKILEKH